MNKDELIKELSQEQLIKELGFIDGVYRKLVSPTKRAKEKWEQTMEQLRSFIEKAHAPIDEKLVEEKVKDFLRKTYDKPIYPISVRELKNFICQLVSEIQPQKSIEDNELFEIKAQEYERGLKDAMVTKKPDEGKVGEFIGIWSLKWIAYQESGYHMDEFLRDFLKEYEELIHGTTRK